MTQRVLVIEDEPDVRRGLRQVLETEGFAVDEASDGEVGLERATASPPDLLILDLSVPGRDGFEVCRELRARGLTLPVLILTARSGELDKVLGFELGADDYVTKPFSVIELLARVKALLRRANPKGDATPEQVIGEARIDLRRYTIRLGSESRELYHYEAEILKLLLAREGEVVARNEILDSVWGEDAFPTTRTVDFHVCNLRKKLESDPAHPKHILTAHGVGYRLVR